MKIILFTILAAAMAAAQKDLDAAELLVTGNEQFTAKMFSEVVKANPGKSVVMSAFSVLTPLAQLSLAAEGPSHDELLRAIGMPNDNATRDVFELINRNYRTVNGVDLKMASRIYVAKTAELDPNFQSLSRELFGSDAKNVDFAKNTETAQEINAWVEDQTNHKIKDLVSSDNLNTDTRLVLVNAIYFKGKWANQFPKEMTADGDFHVSKEKTIKIPFMHRQGDYAYGESAELNAKLLRLPYEGDEASMVIVLPNEIDGLPALEEKLKNPKVLREAINKMYTHDVVVSIPKMKIETTTDLKKVLEQIDVTKIFSARDASLTKLLKGESNLFVSQATQKAFIEVNEEGAEAAAANDFVGFGVSAPNKPRYFVGDRPFYLQIQIDIPSAIFNGVFYGNK